MYDSKNRPKDIAIEAEEKLNEDDKGSTMLKSKELKAIKGMRRKKTTGHENTQRIYIRNWETVD